MSAFLRLLFKIACQKGKVFSRTSNNLCQVSKMLKTAACPKHSRSGTAIFEGEKIKIKIPQYWPGQILLGQHLHMRNTPPEIHAFFSGGEVPLLVPLFSPSLQFRFEWPRRLALVRMESQDLLPPTAQVNRVHDQTRTATYYGGSGTEMLVKMAHTQLLAVLLLHLSSSELKQHGCPSKLYGSAGCWTWISPTPPLETLITTHIVHNVHA